VGSACSAKLSRVENFQTQEEDPDATWKKKPKKQKTHTNPTLKCYILDFSDSFTATE